MKNKQILAICLALLPAFVIVSDAWGGKKKGRIEKPVKEAIDIRQDTQKKEEKWRQDKDAQVARLEQLEQEKEQLEIRQAELLKQVEAARARLAAKEKQLTDIEQISNQILPFLAELIKGLESQPSQGLPFLTEERRQRIDKLNILMAEPGVSVSEKYRKVMEALLVEAEYGYTIEVCQETIPVDSQNILANIFRLGRLSLFYLSLDRKRCGFFNVAEEAWKPLPATHARTIRTAIEIGSKRRPIEFLALPLGRIVAQ